LACLLAEQTETGGKFQPNFSHIQANSCSHGERYCFVVVDAAVYVAVDAAVVEGSCWATVVDDYDHDYDERGQTI